jgi:hypothetical protein
MAHVTRTLENREVQRPAVRVDQAAKTGRSTCAGGQSRNIGRKGPRIRSRVLTDTSLDQYCGAGRPHTSPDTGQQHAPLRGILGEVLVEPATKTVVGVLLCWPQGSATRGKRSGQRRAVAPGVLLDVGPQQGHLCSSPLGRSLGMLLEESSGSAPETIDRLRCANRSSKMSRWAVRAATIPVTSVGSRLRSVASGGVRDALALSAARWSERSENGGGAAGGANGGATGARAAGSVGRTGTVRGTAGSPTAGRRGSGARAVGHSCVGTSPAGPTPTGASGGSITTG